MTNPLDIFAEDEQEHDDVDRVLREEAHETAADEDSASGASRERLQFFSSDPDSDADPHLHEAHDWALTVEAGSSAAAWQADSPSAPSASEESPGPGSRRSGVLALTTMLGVILLALMAGLFVLWRSQTFDPFVDVPLADSSASPTAATPPDRPPVEIGAEPLRPLPGPAAEPPVSPGGNASGVPGRADSAAADVSRSGLPASRKPAETGVPSPATARPVAQASAMTQALNASNVPGRGSRSTPSLVPSPASAPPRTVPPRTAAAPPVRSSPPAVASARTVRPPAAASSAATAPQIDTTTPRPPEPRLENPSGLETPASGAVTTIPRPTEPGSPVASAPVEPLSRAATPPPAPAVSRSAAGAPAGGAAALVATNAEESRVRATLNRYRSAYNALDVGAVKAVWPSVDARALGKAFDRLESQAFEFAGCQIGVSGSNAVAACSGNASYVPKVGSSTPRLESRQWTFDLVKTGDEWTIAHADVR